MRQIAVIVIFLIVFLVVFLCVAKWCHAADPNTPPAWFQTLAEHWLTPIGSVQIQEPNGIGRIITWRINLEYFVAHLRDPNAK